MRKGLLLVFLVIIGAGALAASVFGGIYNRLVTAEEAVKSAWSQVENVYQRRFDLVPNLVEAVRAYAAHERQTFESVVEARSKISQLNISPEIVNNPNRLAEFQEAQGELSFALRRLLVLVERYPELKASQNFLTLQTQLEGTENRITVERRRYNETAQEFNTLRRVFPNVWVANRMGFKEKAYFQAEEGAAKAPQVKF
jgi:LemA protein